jgi:hypothetical protein
MRDAIVPVFGSILCGTDNGATGTVARHQARWLAGADGALELVPIRALTRAGEDALARRCRDHDLLVVGGEPETHAIVRAVPIPVLLARWCCHAGDFTDEILLAVGDSSGAERAAELTAALARRHGGSVSLVGAPGRSPGIGHGLAEAERILSTAEAAPHVLGSQHAPAEHIIPEAAAEAGASLLVIAAGDDRWDAPLIHDIARRAGCSVLALPAPRPELPWARPRPLAACRRRSSDRRGPDR